MKINQELLFEYKAKLISALYPYIWQGWAILCRFIYSEKYFFAPNQVNETMKIIILEDRDKQKLFVKKYRGLDLDKSIELWASENFDNIEKLSFNEFKKINLQKNPIILIIPHSWYADVRRRFFRDFVLVSLLARRKNVKIWIALTDTFDLRTVLPANTMVAISGGAILLQANCLCEATRFGMLATDGHYLWTMPKKVQSDFYTNLHWNQRPKIAAVAKSGDLSRLKKMFFITEQLEELGWEVISTTGSLEYDEYTSIVKMSKIVVTTCEVQDRYLTKHRSYRSRITPETITHRAWEAFASGALLITNNSHLLQVLGFYPGHHFLELYPISDFRSRIEKLTDEELQEISKRGQSRFHELSSKSWNHIDLACFQSSKRKA